MRYTFQGEDGKPKTVTIPKETLDRHIKDLDLSVEEAIDLALFDLGLKRSKEVEALTAKAKESGMSSAEAAERKFCISALNCMAIWCCPKASFRKRTTGSANIWKRSTMR